MERRAGQIPDGFRQAREALEGPERPMTWRERVEFEAQKAEEMARAEARRLHTPQLPLELEA